MVMALFRASASRAFFALILVAGCSLVLAASGGGVGSDKLMMDRFLRWQATYNRSYPTAEETQRRFQVYRRNIEHIEATNRAGNLTYTLGENQFADLTEAEFLDLYTMKGKGMPPMPIRREAGKKQQANFTAVHVDAPISVDWRSKGAVTPVKNQGSYCGSCWSFVTTATIEGITQIKTGKLPSLSEQELIDCDTSNGGCFKGGSVADAYKWVIRNGGITTSASYPYQARVGPCNRGKAADHAARIRSYVEAPEGEGSLQQAVAQQPTASAVDMHGGLQFYSGGVWSGQCGTSVNHAVTVVGYGADAASGAKYWLVKNSWGTTWGERGYLRIRRGVTPGGLCGIALYLQYPVV